MYVMYCCPAKHVTNFGSFATNGQSSQVNMLTPLGTTRDLRYVILLGFCGQVKVNVEDALRATVVNSRDFLRLVKKYINYVSIDASLEGRSVRAFLCRKMRRICEIDNQYRIEQEWEVLKARLASEVGVKNSETKRLGDRKEAWNAW